MSASPASAVPAGPTPTALRLVCRGATLSASQASRVKPPCGLDGWSTDEAADVALLLGRVRDTPTLDDIATQIPDPSTLRPGTLVVVLGELEADHGLLGRLLGTKATAPRALRNSALLALGYERIGGAVDPKTGHDLAWGYVRP